MLFFVWALLEILIRLATLAVRNWPIVLLWVGMLVIASSADRRPV